ncbi:hypothetical protein B0H14DRAFT_2367095 [Mycena olivaceomarginata]|nr:hypothetical protein B0H14DRAFT_2367095 [Mycena olivaceomarginata]
MTCSGPCVRDLYAHKAPIPVCFGIGILVMPKSSRWLAKKHPIEEAEHSLACARGLSKETGKIHAIIQRELEEICLAVGRKQRVKGGWIDCFKPPNKTLYPTWLGWFFVAVAQIFTYSKGMTFQQLTGTNYFFYYGATIFKFGGISDSFVTQIILGAVNVLCTSSDGTWKG